MKNDKIDLKAIYNIKGGTLTSYVIDNPLDNSEKAWCRGAVIIVPGGAYRFCSKREQEVVALEFLSRGYNAFVLEYLTSPDGVHYPEQLLELACAVDYVRKNAQALSINPDEIFAVGFSAGGHLVASLSTDYNIASELYGDDSLCPKLTAAGLIYPVISDEYGHTESHENLFKGTDVSYVEKYIPLTRMDTLASSRTAPAFIFSTFEDKTVSPINSLEYAKALDKVGIRYELHIYSNGGHGMSVATAEINDNATGIERNRHWLDDCAAFFREFTVEKF